MTMKKFLNQVKSRRLKKGFTQADLADKLGVSQPQINRIENGICDISTTHLRKLAKILNCKPYELLSDDSDWQSDNINYLENRIKEFRKLHKMTLTELAIGLNVSYSSLQKVESGVTALDVVWMAKIARFFKIKPYELLPREWQPNNVDQREAQVISLLRKLYK